jgi:hypothetical protein
VKVSQLIEILKDYPQGAEVEMAIVAPVGDDDEIAVDRYPVEDVLPWHDDEDGNHDELVWLVGGEDDDVEVFIAAVDDEPDDEHDHEHDHDHPHDHDQSHGHGHGHGGPTLRGA